MDSKNIKAVVLTLFIIVPSLFIYQKSIKEEAVIIEKWKTALSQLSTENVSYKEIKYRYAYHSGNFVGPFKTLPHRTEYSYIVFNEYDHLFFIQNEYPFLNESELTLTSFILEGKKCVYSIDAKYKDKKYIIFKLDENLYPLNLESFVNQKCISL